MRRSGDKRTDSATTDGTGEQTFGSCATEARQKILEQHEDAICETDIAAGQRANPKTRRSRGGEVTNGSRE